MKKVVCFCLFIIIYHFSSQCQTIEIDSIPSITITSLELKVYNKPLLSNYGVVGPFTINYKGELIHSLAHLLGVPITRIRTNPNPPVKYISYNVFSSTKTNELEQRVLDDLIRNFNFEVSDTIDICDVWVLTVKDSSKLDRFSWEKDSPNGTTWAGWHGNRKEYHYFGSTLTHVAKDIETLSEKFICLTDSDDTADEPQRYKFTVPYPYDDINALSSFLEKKYGVVLIREKRAIKKVYVNFKKE